MRSNLKDLKILLRNSLRSNSHGESPNDNRHTKSDNRTRAAISLAKLAHFYALVYQRWLDRQSDRKGIEHGVKKIKASFKGEKKRTFAEKSKTDLVFERWMYFGSGFYGLAALWTLVVI